MATIGTVTKHDNGHYEGELRTLSVRADITILPVTDKATHSQPDFRPLQGRRDRCRLGTHRPDVGEGVRVAIDDADGSAFLDRSDKDPHQFRFVVSADEGARLADLKPFVRDLLVQMERDLDTKLDWVAVDISTPATLTPTSSSAGATGTAATS